MSHPEQMAFLRAVARANGELVTGGRVLEIGSHDVNGSARSLFAASSKYVGVDLSEGPGVDMVGFGHEVALPDDSFDMSVSAECFEHDPHWAETFANMVRLTRPGGVVAFTCATRGRPEHGTGRTRRDESPGTQAVGIDYYRNLMATDFTAALPLAEWFDSSRFWTSRHSFDLYFVGIVKGGSPQMTAGQFPHALDVEAIDGIMTRPERLVRLPLRAASAVVRREDLYQSIVLGYWKQIHRIREAGHVAELRRRFRNTVDRR